MIKKFLIILFLIFFISMNFIDLNANCNLGGDVAESIENCIGGGKTSLVETGNNMNVDDGFKAILIKWTTKIATFLALGAIFSIVFGSLKMVLSTGEEEQIKKAKDIIKWGMLGLLGIVSAGFIISLVVKLIYSLGNV